MIALNLQIFLIINMKTYGLNNLTLFGYIQSQQIN